MRRIVLALATLSFAFSISAQQPAVTTVPNLIRYGGALKDANGAPIAAPTGVTFAIYKQQDGGAPVWMETQNVMPDANGQYTAILGSTMATGLPRDLFSQEEQRWLGVQVQGQVEQPRVLLVSVPYAFKAQEAETLGGLPPSAFALAAPSSSSRNAVAELQSVGGSGTTNYLALWTSSTDLGNSQIYQLSNRIGIATTTPSSTLDVAGDVNVGPSNTYRVGQNKVLSTAGTANLFLGSVAGYGNTTGNSDTYGGYAAGYWNTTGSSNTFTGYEAGYRNTSGGNNAFTGANAGLSNTTGAFNTFAGYGAGKNNTTGSYNIYIANNGPASGNESNAIRIGSANQSQAYVAGIYGAATSSGSAVFVDSTGKLGTTGGTGGVVTSFNGRSGAVMPASGDYSFGLLSGTLGSSQFSGTYGNAVTLSNTSNVFYGDGSHLSGVLSQPGSPYYIQNTTSQQSSANFNISGNGTVGGTLSANVVNTLSTSTNQTYQVNGSGVLGIGNPSDENLFLGVGAGASDVVGSGQNNTFIGPYAGASNTTGSLNTFDGADAGASNTTGSLNTFDGGYAGAVNTTGFANTFVGEFGGRYNTTGANNTFIGAQAGVENTTGTYNTFVGGAAGQINTTGGDNTFNGFESGQNNATGYFNTLIGFTAGYSNTTGNGNTFVGAEAGYLNTTGSNDIYIGNEGPISGTESNTIRIGGDVGGSGPQTSVYIVGINGSTSSSGVPVYVNASGQLGTSPSSLRFKEQIHDMGDRTSLLMKLRPVTFFYKQQYDGGSQQLQFGLIAEEVAKVYPDMVAYDKDGAPYTVKYQYLAPMLLNELQKQHAVVAAQQERISEMEQRLARLEALIGK